MLPLLGAEEEELGTLVSYSLLNRDREEGKEEEEERRGEGKKDVEERLLGD